MQTGQVDRPTSDWPSGPNGQRHRYSTKLSSAETFPDEYVQEWPTQRGESQDPRVPEAEERRGKKKGKGRSSKRESRKPRASLQHKLERDKDERGLRSQKGREEKRQTSTTVPKMTSTFLSSCQVRPADFVSAALRRLVVGR